MMRKVLLGRRCGGQFILWIELVLLTVAGACKAPSRPSPVVSGLSIRPQKDILKVGETVEFTTVLMGPEGSHPVAAAWSTDSPSHLRVDPRGSVTGLARGTATLTASYETYTAARDLRIVADVTGTWSGQYRVENCQRLSGGGPSYCKSEFGAVLPFRLRIQQSEDTVTGILEFFSNLNNLVESGPLSGTLDTGGSLTIRAVVRLVSDEHVGETVVDDWRSVVNDEANAIRGQFTRNLRFQNAWGPQTSREECAIQRLERSQ